MLAPTLPSSKATVEELRERVQSTIRAENQAVAVRAEAVAELRRREGTELVETVLQKDGLLSRRRARSEVETADELSKLPRTADGLRKGEISRVGRWGRDLLRQCPDHRGGIETGRDRRHQTGQHCQDPVSGQVVEVNRVRRTRRSASMSNNVPVTTACQSWSTSGPATGMPRSTPTPTME